MKAKARLYGTALPSYRRYRYCSGCRFEYDPKDYPKLLQPILDGNADVVYGSRFIGEPHRVMYFWHQVANNILTTISNMLTNLNLTDMEVCYKVLTREVVINLS